MRKLANKLNEILNKLNKICDILEKNIQIKDDRELSSNLLDEYLNGVKHGNR